MLIQSKLLLKPEPFTKTPTQKQILSSKQFIQASHAEYKYFRVYSSAQLCKIYYWPVYSSFNSKSLTILK